jgi:hypothetical protein
MLGQQSLYLCAHLRFENYIHRAPRFEENA